jgi:hypothetical protein
LSFWDLRQIKVTISALQAGKMACFADRNAFREVLTWHKDSATFFSLPAL